MYTACMREMVLPHRQNTVGVCNQIALLILYSISSRLVIALLIHYSISSRLVIALLIHYSISSRLVIALLIHYSISSRLVTLLRVIDAPVQVSDIFDLAVSFKFNNFSFKIFRYSFFLFLKCPLDSRPI